VPRILIALLTALLVLAAAPAAQAGERVASPRFHTMPARFSAIVSVGERYVVYGEPHFAGHTVWSADTKTLTARELTLPAGCRVWAGETSEHDRFLAACAEGSIVVDAATGATLWGPQPAGDGLGGAWDTEQWRWVGDQWLEDMDGTVLNWHTGERRTPGTTQEMSDLDDPALGAGRFCRPFQRDDRWAAGQQDGRLVFVRRGPRADRAFYVGRCGSSKLARVYAFRLTRPISVGSDSILGGWAVWSSGSSCGGTIRSYDVRTGHRFRWTTTGVHGRRCFSLDKTRYAAVITYEMGSSQWDGSDEEYRLSRLAIAHPPR